MADEDLPPGEKMRELARRPRKKHNWPEIKRIYVEGEVDDKGERTWPSLQRVAVLFDMHESRVRERSAQEKWSTERAMFQSNLEKVRQQKRLDTLSKEAIDLDKRSLDVSKLGLQLVTMRVGEIVRKAATLQSAKAKREKNMPLSPAEEAALEDDMGVPAVEAREVETLARAAEAWQRVAAKALGEVETTRTEITGVGGAPLEVRSQVTAEITQDNPDRLYGVVVALQRAGLAALPAELAQDGPRALEDGGDDGGG